MFTETNAIVVTWAHYIIQLSEPSTFSSMLTYTVALRLFQFSQFFPTTYSSLQNDSFQGDFVALINRQTPDSVLAHSFASAWGGLRQQQFELEHFPLPFDNVSTVYTNPIFNQFLRSDHTSFWMADLPAIFLSDSGMWKRFFFSR